MGKVGLAQGGAVEYMIYRRSTIGKENKLQKELQ